jgi:hypothetical protein
MVRVAALLTPRRVALMEAAVTELTAEVLIVNVPEVAPPFTWTVAGTCVLALELDNGILIPPDFAGPFRVTVPTEDFPPVRVLGATCRDVSAAVRIVRVAVLLVPEKVPLMDAVVVDPTADVVMAKVAEVAPAFTWTLVGTFAFVFELDNVTFVPPAGAGRMRVTVAVDVLLPTTEAGARLSALKA